MIPQPNEIYRHFKGNLYRIVTIAENSETGEQMVVYQALYGEYKVYVRPLLMFMEPVDSKKYPDVQQKMQFELVKEMVNAVPVQETADSLQKEQEKVFTSEEKNNSQVCTVTENFSETAAKKASTEIFEEAVDEDFRKDTLKTEISNQDSFRPDETPALDPLLEAYLDADTYRERLNILHGLHHRITHSMINTMAVVVDVEIPEGDIEDRYDALHSCLLTREKYECTRLV